MGDRAADLIDKIFELDAQYKGGVIKASNRAVFLRKHAWPVVKAAMDEAYAGYRLAY